MTPGQPAHRAPSKLTRRRVLGIAGLLAVPVITVAGLRHRDNEGTAAEATPRSSASVSASPSSSTSAAPKVITSGGGPVPFEPGKVMLGAYLDLSGKTLTQSLALRRRQLGREEKILHVFYAWTDTLPTSIPGMAAGTIPMISWRGAKYADILAGQYDTMIARNARRLAATKKPMMLRWAWEMNGNWYAWGGDNNPAHSAGFVQAWKHVWTIFQEQGAKNVSWVWSPNWASTPADAWNQIPEYYPGDKYVDWVGLSGYNLRRETPTRMFDKFYAMYSATKPVMITEVGAVDRGGTTKGDWITLFAQWVDTRPGVGAVTWFDTDTHPGSNEKWRIDTDADSLAAYKAMATSARFSG